MSIHPTAHISSEAIIGRDVEVGPFSIIHPNVQIGNGTVIGSHCEIGVPTRIGDGTPLVIGDESLIRSHSIFYESSVLGRKLTTGHRVTVREMTKAGENLQIGTLSDIQGHCEIGDYVRFHSNVHVGQHSRIEDFVWIFPYVVLTNDPHPPSETQLGVNLRKYAVVATMSVVLPGVTVGEGALIGASSCVTRDVADHRIVSGNPATDRGPTSKIKLRDGSGRPAYPWISHFRRGYPASVGEIWDTIDSQSNSHEAGE